MINKSPAFLISTIMLVMLFMSTYVYAENSPSFTQSHVPQDETPYNNKSAEKLARQQLEETLFSSSIDQLFKYELETNKSTGIKVHSSVGLKLRSDETLFQFKMKF